VATYIWSPASGRYHDQDTGRFVSNLAINQAVDSVIAQAATHLAGLTQQLQSGAITLADWQAGMAQEIKLLHTGAAALGRGGWQQMSASDWGWTGQRIKQQYQYLTNFAHDIATGKQAMDGRLIARAMMYADATRSTQKEMQRRTGMLRGNLEERNVLGAAEHCAGCLSASGMGWVPIGTLPPIGARQCRSRCRCSIITREHTRLMAA